MMKLNVLAFGMTTGLLLGFGLLFITWWIMLFEGAAGDTTLVGRIYLGYRISLGGSFFGLIWGLVDGFVGGVFSPGSTISSTVGSVERNSKN